MLSNNIACYAWTSHSSYVFFKIYILYVKGTLKFGLHLSPFSPNTLLSWGDAHWGGCPDIRWSTSEYFVYLESNLTYWFTKHQPTLSRSSAELEYRDVVNVVFKLCWLCNLLLELHCPIEKATLVYCDNVNVVCLSDNPVHYQCTKHIKIDIHFIREKVARG